MSNDKATDMIKVLGIDIAKNVFHLVGIDKHGKVVLRKKINRNKLMEFIALLPACLIGLEACGGAHDWAGKFIELDLPFTHKLFVHSHFLQV